MLKLKMCTVPIIIFIFITGCLYSLGTKVTGNKIGGQYLLHDNPRAGDYAEYKVFHRMKQSGTVGGEIMWDGIRRVEIESIKNGVIKIREVIEVQKIYKMAASSEVMMPYARVDRYTETHIYTDMSGMIRRYQFRKSPIGKMSTHPLAKQGDSGYISYRKINKSVQIKGADKTWDTYPAWYRRDFSVIVNACIVRTVSNATTYDIRYINNSVKFKTVMNHILINASSTGEVSEDLYFVSDLVQGLSFTPFFASPLSFFSRMGKNSLKQYLLKTATPSGKDGLKKFLNIIGNRSKRFESTFDYMYIITLTKQGRAEMP